MSQPHLISPIVRNLTGALLTALLTVLYLPPAAVYAQAATGAPTYRHVMLELDAAPAAQVYAAARAAAADQADLAAATRAQLATVEAEQEQVLAALAGVDAQVLYRVQRAYNGVALRVAADQMPALAALPHVRAVHTMTPKTPANAVSVPFIGAPALWTGAAGQSYTGAGLTIAVIDTGVDYLHAAFGGSRRYADNDATVIGDVPDFPGPKIVAGYDFAGDGYDADPDNATYNPIPAPDPDPTDCYGHGTHVAATAAGFGVLNDGSGGFGGTFTGPYDAAVQTRSFLIGPGVAPQANIVALKIFGCRGSSDLTELAIDWAVDPNGDGDFADKVDVINMSIGSPYGTTDDPTAVASDNAALAGVIVVASAGNDGNVYFAVGSPGVADRAVSVAAIRNHLNLTGDPVAAPVATTSFTVRGPRPGDSALKPDIAAPGQGVNSAVMGAPGWYSGTWSGTSMAAPHVAGALTLLRQRYPSWSVEELKALVMNSAAFAVDDGVILPSPARVGAGIIDLTRALDAPLVAMDARGNGRVSLSFTPADVLDVYTDTLDLRLVNKQGITLTYAPLYAPVVDLPGVDIRPDAPTVTVRPNGNALLPVQMTARAEAMGHPRPADVNATSSYPRHWLDEESGRLELWPTGPVYHAALQATMAAPAPTDDPHGTADLSYDPTSETLTYQLTVTNAEATAFSQIELRAATATGEPGAVVATLPAPTTVTTATNTAIGATTLAPDVARAMANGRLMLRAVKPGTQPLELTGPITADALVLQTPVFATARRMADLHSVAPALMLDPVPGIITATLTLTGAGRAATTRADGGPALMTILARQFSSPQQAAGDARADLQYIGISSDLYQDVNGPIANRRLYMGLTTYGAWTSPNEVRMDIFIDTDEDGVDDYRLFNADALGYASDDATSDGLVAVVETLARGTFSALEPLNGQTALDAETAPFRTNVMVLPVRAVDIGLSDEDTGFDYRVETWAGEQLEPVEVTPVLHYDLRAAGLDLVGREGQGPSFVAVPGAPVTLRVDMAAFPAGPRTDLLIIHHHNVAANRVEIVPVEVQWATSLYFPIISSAGR